VIGLVTLEDALEELVGEIADEFDPEGRPPLERDGDALVADGEASLRQISEELGVALAEGHEATIGGLLLERLGRMPEPGERVQLDGLEIEVREASDGRIRSVRIAPGDAQYSREAR
jgi:CBS domain containing-hemolysin-like protein